jgi:rare lipoprotein A (peptidoglycan hydrolase)
MKKAAVFIELLLVIVWPCLAQQRQEGNAFWYESHDPGMYISHATYPCGTKLTVTNLDNNRRTIMQVGGRIPQDP